MLKLCEKHRQELSPSNYAEENCNYCELLQSNFNMHNKILKILKHVNAFDTPTAPTDNDIVKCITDKFDALKQPHINSVTKLENEIKELQQRLMEKQLEHAKQLLNDARTFCMRKDANGDCLNISLAKEIDQFLKG